MKGSTIAGLLVVAGIAGVGALLGSGIDELTEVVVEPARLEGVRVVRLSGDCPAVDSPCEAGQFQRKGHCLCLSTLEEVPGEQKPEAIPAAERRRKVLRCNHEDPETGQTSHVVRTEPITEPPAGAIIIDPNLSIDASFNGFEGPLLKKMQAKCCQGCMQDCWVTKGSWKQCPACLCDNSCGNYCP